MMIEAVWEVSKVLFRLYQYTCYFCVIMLLLPVVGLYIFDITLYLWRLFSYGFRYQVYHIKYQTDKVKAVKGRKERISRSLLKRSSSADDISNKSYFAVDGKDQQCDSSNISILSAFEESKESLLSDTPYSSNYCLTSINYDAVGKLNSPRIRSTAPIISNDMNSILSANSDADIPKLRRTKSSDVALSLDRYDTQRVRATS